MPAAGAGCVGQRGHAADQGGGGDNDGETHAAEQRAA